MRRRIAHETAVHAWDAGDAVGSREPLDPALAVDGIDEFFEIFSPLTPGPPVEPVTTVHLHATDAEGEWLVSVGGGQFEIEHGHAKGDVAVRATASDLLLLLWNRVDLSRRAVRGVRRRAGVRSAPRQPTELSRFAA